MATSQFFKTEDAQEQKFYNAALVTSQGLEIQKDLFYDDAFACAVLGDLLYDNNLAPLARAIPRDIFRTSFATIFESFIAAGTAESYLTVFRNIFGDDVEVTFTVPAAGRLNIDIVAAGIQEYLFETRYIEDNLYVKDIIIDDEGDNIVFQGIKGFDSQYELEQMLFEMVPDGIYTVITLTIN